MNDEEENQSGVVGVATSGDELATTTNEESVVEVNHVVEIDETRKRYRKTLPPLENPPTIHITDSSADLRKECAAEVTDELDLNGTRVTFPDEEEKHTIVVHSNNGLDADVVEETYSGCDDFDTNSAITTSIALDDLPTSPGPPDLLLTPTISPSTDMCTSPALSDSRLCTHAIGDEDEDVITSGDKKRVQTTDRSQGRRRSTIARYTNIPSYEAIRRYTLGSNEEPFMSDDELEEIIEVKQEKKTQHKEERQQIVFMNDYAANKKARRRMPSNYIRTTKYTWYSFIPLNLLEQFRKISNIYFLITMIITLIPGISPVLPESSILPLVFILGITALKDGLEDLARFREDLKANGVPVQVLRDGALKKIKTSNIRIGDVVYISRDEAFPADLICLCSHRDDGACYVQTANLDGESNLKPKLAVKETSHVHDVTVMSTVKAKVKVELPNARLDKFNGSIRLKSIEDKKVKTRRSPLDVDNLLMRGSVLKNTKYVYGLVVYVGEHTRLFKNLKKPKSRLSLLDKRLNILLIVLIFFQQVLCALFVGLSAFYQNKKGGKSFYLKGLAKARANGDFIVRNWMTYFILLNSVIPMSLFTVLELIKAFQAKLMEADNEMKMEDDKGNWISMRAKTSNMNQELSQMDVIFSDKTGTLTENVMEYRQCWVNGTYFGEDKGMLTWLQKHPKVTPCNDPQDFIRYHMYMIHEFLLGLILNHSVIPEMNEKDELIYEGPSPDEIALLKCAKENGYVLTQKSPSGLEVEILGQKYFFEILTTLAFTSDRKRMSVITKAPDGKIIIYSKGADNIMFERSVISTQDKQDMERALEVFAQKGHRTLVIARKELTQKDFDHWYQQYHAACLSTQKNKDELVEDYASMMERGFQVLGATAIEDKLQQGVPESIEFLRRAGFQIWMLTGDKPETGRNIAYTANLIQKNTVEIRIQGANSRRHCKKKMMIAWNFLEEHKDKHVDYALLIDAQSLFFVLGHKKIEKKLVQIINYCQTAICCRLTALQKADIVRLVERSCNKKGLSIGDGVNDVSMIQAASVGIGIIGREGSQAARASDYAIPRFRHLVRLLAVHGRYCYIRNSDYLHTSFYKNLIIVYGQLLFAIFNGFTGATLYDSWITTLYNTIFTVLPPLISGTFEKDLPEEVLLENPELYKYNKKDALFNLKTLVSWFVTGLFHTAVIFFGCYFMSETSILGKKQDDRWSHGLIIITTGITVIMLRHALELKNWTIITHVAMWASWLSYIIFIVLYSLIHSLFGTRTFYWMAYNVFSSLKTWLLMLLLVTVCILPAYAFKVVKRHLFPSQWEVMLLKYANNKKLRGTKNKIHCVD